MALAILSTSVLFTFSLPYIAPVVGTYGFADFGWNSIFPASCMGVVLGGVWVAALLLRHPYPATFYTTIEDLPTCQIEGAGDKINPPDYVKSKSDSQLGD